MDLSLCREVNKAVDFVTFVVALNASFVSYFPSYPMIQTVFRIKIVSPGSIQQNSIFRFIPPVETFDNANLTDQSFSCIYRVTLAGKATPCGCQWLDDSVSCANFVNVNQKDELYIDLLGVRSTLAASNFGIVYIPSNDESDLDSRWAIIKTPDLQQIAAKSNGSAIIITNFTTTSLNTAEFSTLTMSFVIQGQATMWNQLLLTFPATFSFLQYYPISVCTFAIVTTSGISKSIPIPSNCSSSLTFLTINYTGSLSYQAGTYYQLVIRSVPNPPALGASGAFRVFGVDQNQSIIARNDQSLDLVNSFIFVEVSEPLSIENSNFNSNAGILNVYPGSSTILKVSSKYGHAILRTRMTLSVVVDDPVASKYCQVSPSSMTVQPGAPSVSFQLQISPDCPPVFSILRFTKQEPLSVSIYQQIEPIAMMVAIQKNTVIAPTNYTITRGGYSPMYTISLSNPPYQSLTVSLEFSSSAISTVNNVLSFSFDQNTVSQNLSLSAGITVNSSITYYVRYRLSGANAASFTVQDNSTIYIINSDDTVNPIYAANIQAGSPLNLTIITVSNTQFFLYYQIVNAGNPFSNPNLIALSIIQAGASYISNAQEIKGYFFVNQTLAVQTFVIPGLAGDTPYQILLFGRSRLGNVFPTTFNYSFTSASYSNPIFFRFGFKDLISSNDLNSFICFFAQQLYIDPHYLISGSGQTCDLDAYAASSHRMLQTQATNLQSLEDAIANATSQAKFASILGTLQELRIDPRKLQILSLNQVTSFITSYQLSLEMGASAFAQEVSLYLIFDARIQGQDPNSFLTPINNLLRYSYLITQSGLSFTPFLQTYGQIGGSNDITTTLPISASPPKYLYGPSSFTVVFQLVSPGKVWAIAMVNSTNITIPNSAQIMQGRDSQNNPAAFFGSVTLNLTKTYEVQPGRILFNGTNSQLSYIVFYTTGVQLPNYSKVLPTVLNVSIPGTPPKNDKSGMTPQSSKNPHSPFDRTSLVTCHNHIIGEHMS